MRCPSSPSSPGSSARATQNASRTSRSGSVRSSACRTTTSSTSGLPRCCTTSGTSASTIPRSVGRAIEPSEVTDKGAEILRQTEYLRPAGDLLASDTASVGSQILRVVSAFDELTAGDPAFNEAAIEALYSGPGYVYDPRVLDALERVCSAEPKVPTRV